MITPLEYWFPHIFLAGAGLMAIGVFSLWLTACLVSWKWGVGSILFPPALIVFAFRHPRVARNPVILAGVGLVAMAFPPIYAQLTPIDLGPRDKIVDGERHVTLTGWDRKDYSILQRIPDAVVLQMANADVTDAVIEPLATIENLRELDLNDTKVTDAGLATLGSLSRLERLRLRGTAITDQGFGTAIAPLESLREIDLRATGVSRDAVQRWKSAKPGRRALQ